ncbi:helix-turn-helix domain-containing protein [Cupriavidus basilensis]|uniref:helix-turn-helix domain-containing protein n=1 Tax=Cupriavidus TaxID=106589 RepID=UPI000451927C|nr:MULTISPECIES: helix-turn-helix transcriptional regulator [Cupriavidus]KDP84825.1 XRE family transcriptional regulator [Cupriavidus sp. SK-3]MDF3888966.1 helix-turn-helix transcriptional regulator [Cupriavidus basilensis]
MVKIQFIERDGHPEFAVVPIEVWERIKRRTGEWDDGTLPGHAEAREDGFRIPAAILDAELAGDNPIKAWREYRRMTQDALATAAGLSKPYLSQIENRKRDGSVEVFQSLAEALHVPLDVLVGREGK